MLRRGGGLLEQQVRVGGAGGGGQEMLLGRGCGLLEKQVLLRGGGALLQEEVLLGGGGGGLELVLFLRVGRSLLEEVLLRRRARLLLEQRLIVVRARRAEREQHGEAERDEAEGQAVHAPPANALRRPLATAFPVRVQKGSRLRRARGERRRAFPFRPRMKRAALQLYRLAVLLVIAGLIRAHAVRLRVEGHAPISVAEVRELFPHAESIHDDDGPRGGAFVRDGSGTQIGYVVRTAPHTDAILGYRGWTDTLIAFDGELRVAGVRIRSSRDTREHMGDVREDRHFLKTWNGKPWEEVARVAPEAQGIEGVSGASMTSMAVAEAIQRRLQMADAALAAVLSWKYQALHAWMIASP